MALTEEASKALSVTQAANLAQRTLESVRVLIEGEVSQVTDKRGYSAVYFTIKDETSQLPCRMWAGKYQGTGVKLRVGALVQVSGRFTYYGPRGSFSFDVFSLQLAGEGNLRVQVAQIAERLRLEGLMNPERKAAIPVLPERIGLVTSPRGAAVRDVLRTLRRRYPLGEVLVCGVPVEGKEAARYMTEALQVAVEGGSQVILLVRGGGSFEDLMPFNDEGLARAVAACPVPVVTGIGHEPDNSICDMVADFRASTPTAAAEAVAPDAVSLGEMLGQYGDRMNGYFNHKLEVTQMFLDRLAQRPVFTDEQALTGGFAIGLDAQDERLDRAIPAALARDAQMLLSLGIRLKAGASGYMADDDAKLQELEMRLHASVPEGLARDRARLDAVAQRMRVGAAQITALYERDVQMRASRLNDLSPLAVLGRGYALARDEQGAIVRTISQAPPGSKVRVSVSDGSLECMVEGSSENAERISDD